MMELKQPIVDTWDTPLSDRDIFNMLSDKEKLNNFIAECIGNSRARIDKVLDCYSNDDITSKSAIPEGQLRRIRTQERTISTASYVHFCRTFAKSGAHRMIMGSAPWEMPLPRLLNVLAVAMLSCPLSVRKKIAETINSTYPSYGEKWHMPKLVPETLCKKRIAELAEDRNINPSNLYVSSILKQDLQAYMDDEIRSNMGLDYNGLLCRPEYPNQVIPSYATANISSIMKLKGLPNIKSLILLSLSTKRPIDYFVSPDYLSDIPVTYRKDNGDEQLLDDSSTLSVLSSFVHAPLSERSKIFADIVFLTENMRVA